MHAMHDKLSTALLAGLQGELFLNPSVVSLLN